MEIKSRAAKPPKKPLDAKQSVRREVLGAICLYWFDNNQSALALELDVEPSFVINSLSGLKPMGEKVAEDICSKLVIPPGSLDTPLSGPLGPRESKPFERRGVGMLSDTNVMRALKLEQIPEGPEMKIIDTVIDTALEEARKRAAAERQKQERKQ